MDDVVTAQLENENLRKIRLRLMQWEAKNQPLAALSAQQEEYIDIINNICAADTANESNSNKAENSMIENNASTAIEADALQMPQESQGIIPSAVELLNGNALMTTNDFLMWYNRVQGEIHENNHQASYNYLQQLLNRSSECSLILEQLDEAMKCLNTLNDEYAFVSEKTKSLNTASEQLIDEQQKLQTVANDIEQRLHYFNQADAIHQSLQSPTLSVASDTFRDYLNKIDSCLNYLADHPKYKDSSAYTLKYKQCLNKAVSLMRNYVCNILSQATEAILNPKHTSAVLSETVATSPDAAFALYYGKYQISAVKVKRISEMLETRVELFREYANLLTELQQHYLKERLSIMTPAVEKAIADIKSHHKGDHCTLTRSACAFLVNICQDEQRLYFQFFVKDSDQLTIYLEHLCNILYDTLRPFIIHINHLETLAEICSILRIEMLEEHVQQNPTALKAFATIANQLLQDVQERLVFRAHLYLQSDILNYKPSIGDLAYPEKLEMMESIALSLEEGTQLGRSDSRTSLASNATEADSVYTSVSRARSINSPADLHGMWYPTVRRTLVCLSRLYRCVDRPIFQGLSQEALKLCIQSVAAASEKISQAKTALDGELFEIKHLLILREQIAPFRVDFTIKETSLDFSKVKTAAFSLLQKRKQLFAMGSNNALLEFLLDGTPQVKEHLMDSRKEVDRQLKLVCEQFIRDAVQALAGPLLAFLKRADCIVIADNRDPNKSGGINYSLRQSNWASPQQISCVIQETQRLIKNNLPSLQRSMQLYLSNRDTEFIIFRLIRNNIIQSFVRLEQMLTTNGYTTDDMIITSCPSAEQISVLLSTGSILANEGMVNFLSSQRKLSVNSEIESVQEEVTPTNINNKLPLDKAVSFESQQKTSPANTDTENISEPMEAHLHQNDQKLTPTNPLEPA